MPTTRDHIPGPGGLLSVLALLCAAPLAALVPGSAAAGDVSPSDAATIEVMPGWRTEDGTHMAALRVTLADGWKTYWRAPGDAGIPPAFSWKGSQNIAGVAFHWPVPQVFELGGMRSIGYKHELILPMEFHASDSGAPMTLAGSLMIGVCEEICVPMEASFSADLPATGAARDPEILAALAARPMSPAEAGVVAATCEAEPIGDGMQVAVSLTMPSLGAHEETAIELMGEPVWVSEPETSRDGGVLRAVADIVPSSAKPFPLDRSDLRITVLADGRAVDVVGCTGS